MVKCEVATVKSTIKTFGKYTQIRTNVTFNKNVIKAIENNKPLNRSIRNILHKYERTEIANCIYCGSSTNSKRIAILTERVCKDEKEANSVVKDQEKGCKIYNKITKQEDVE